VSESDIVGTIDYLSDIENLVSLKGYVWTLPTFLNIKCKYSYYLCQYHYFEIHAKSIMNSVHVKYKDDTILSIHLWLI